MPASTFADRHRTLVWSNSRAGDEVYLRAALLKPHFYTTLDACATFGIATVRREWRLLTGEGTHEARRAAPAIERMLRNIELGFGDAATRH